jgi:hypothetical protein
MMLPLPSRSFPSLQDFEGHWSIDVAEHIQEVLFAVRSLHQSSACVAWYTVTCLCCMIHGHMLVLHDTRSHACVAWLGLARTVLIRRIWPYIWWFSCQNYRIYTVYIWFWPTLCMIHGHACVAWYTVMLVLHDTRSAAITWKCTVLYLTDEHYLNTYFINSYKEQQWKVSKSIKRVAGIVCIFYVCVLTQNHHSPKQCQGYPQTSRHTLFISSHHPLCVRLGMLCPCSHKHTHTHTQTHTHTYTSLRYSLRVTEGKPNDGCLFVELVAPSKKGFFSNLVSSGCTICWLLSLADLGGLMQKDMVKKCSKLWYQCY